VGQHAQVGGSFAVSVGVATHASFVLMFHVALPVHPHPAPLTEPLPCRRFTPEQALQHEWAKSQAPVPQPAAPPPSLPFFDAPKPPAGKPVSGGNLTARGDAAKVLQTQQPQQPVKGYLNMAFRDRHLFPPLDLGNKLLAQQPPAKVHLTAPSPRCQPTHFTNPPPTLPPSSPSSQQQAAGTSLKPRPSPR
jgi:hypothetical protein